MRIIAAHVGHQKAKKPRLLPFVGIQQGKQKAGAVGNMIIIASIIVKESQI